MPIIFPDAEYDTYTDLALNRPTEEKSVPISDDKAPSVLDVAKEQYPVLKDLDYGYTENTQSNGKYLEHWPAGETGSTDSPRPSTLPIDKPGLEVFRKDTRPIDVAGDIVSHHLINTDPVIKQHYEDFQKSLTPQQNDTLKDQYNYAKDKQDESRSFEDWKKSSGLPSYFRGYAFDQWPKDEIKDLYTTEQLNRFDSMNRYLKGQPELKDPFDIAASRLKGQVQPLEGRTEGLTTKVLEHLPEMALSPAGLPAKLMQAAEGARAGDHESMTPLVDASAETALAIGMSGYSTAMYRPGVGMFGGRMSMDAINTAERLESKGVSARSIKEITGMERAADTTWRKEFSDHLAEYKEPTSDSIKMGTALKHDNLYQVYPEAKNIQLNYKDKLENMGEYYSASKDNPPIINLRKGMPPEETKSTLLHEVQHYIQDVEKVPFAHEVYLHPEDLAALKTKLAKDWLGNNETGREYAQEIINRLEKGDREGANTLALKVLEVNDYKVYSHMTKEVEARNTQLREKLTPNERRRSLASDTEDVPRHLQTYLDESGIAEPGKLF